jgi:hypothetical protein
MNAQNKHPTTGIAFGVIGAHVLDPDLIDRLLYSQQAVNTSYETAKKTFVDGMRYDFECEQKEDQHPDEKFDEELAVELFGDRFQNDEPTIEGEIDDVKYASIWIGGALHFFIFESPIIGSYLACSPCVPGAGDLHNADANGITTYDVPPYWRA